MPLKRPAAHYRVHEDECILALVDFQERLAPAMPEGVGEKLVRNACTLAQAAREFGIPVILTEQYPRGLGKTVPELMEALGGDVQALEKVEFNCCRVTGVMDALQKAAPRRQVVLCGIESHVCVLQSALGLMEAGYEVFVAADAVGSRSKLNWKLSLELLRQAGVVVGSCEIFLFQWLQAAGSERFKRLSKLVK
jgi:nicotinamidase-related amidase